MNFSIAPAESPSSVRVNTEASLHKNIDQQHTVSAVGEYDVLEWLVWCYLAWCLMGNMPSMNKMTM